VSHLTLCQRRNGHWGHGDKKTTAIYLTDPTKLKPSNLHRVEAGLPLSRAREKDLAEIMR